MKNVIIYFIIVLFIIFCWSYIVKDKKDKCENAGGVYTWELNKGDMCYTLASGKLDKGE